MPCAERERGQPCSRVVRNRLFARTGLSALRPRMPRSRLYLLEHGEDFTFESLDVRFNCLQRARRFVAVEMAVEQNFVAYLCLAMVNPRIRHVRQDFAFEI